MLLWLIPSWAAVLFFVDKYKPARYRYKTHQQVRQSKTCYSGTPPYDHPGYKTTSLLRQYSLKTNVKTIESFYYFEDPVNATTGFYGPTEVALTGFHCRMAKAIKLWSRLQLVVEWAIRSIPGDTWQDKIGKPYTVAYKPLTNTHPTPPHPPHTSPPRQQL